MTDEIVINGPLIRALRLAAAYTASDLGAAIGLRPEAIRRLEGSDTKILTVMTGQQLIGLARTLGTTVDALTHAEQAMAAEASDDAVEMLALLHGQPRHIKPTVLADSLGWNLSRLTEARKSLNARLEPLGLAVRDAPRGWRLCLLGTHTALASTLRLVATQAEIHGLDRPTAEILYQVAYSAPSSTEGGHPPGQQRLRRLIALEHLGAIDNADHPVPSAAVRYALNIP